MYNIAFLPFNFPFKNEDFTIALVPFTTLTESSFWPSDFVGVNKDNFSKDSTKILVCYDDLEWLTTQIDTSKYSLSVLLTGKDSHYCNKAEMVALFTMFNNVDFCTGAISPTHIDLIEYLIKDSESISFDCGDFSYSDNLHSLFVKRLEGLQTK